MISLCLGKIQFQNRNTSTLTATSSAYFCLDLTFHVMQSYDKDTRLAGR